MRMAHEYFLSDHFSIQKTEHKIREEFFWPGKVFCRSCEVCQRIKTNCNVPSVQIGKICPISILKELWENKTMAIEQRTVYRYVFDMKMQL